MAGDPAPPPPADDGARAEMADAPPFLTWRAIYAIVLAALVVEIVAGTILTSLYR